MGQRCYSCGRESPLGGPLLHFDGCDVGTASAEAALQRELEQVATDEDTRTIARILAEEAEEAEANRITSAMP